LIPSLENRPAVFIGVLQHPRVGQLWHIMGIKLLHWLRYKKAKLARVNWLLSTWDSQLCHVTRYKSINKMLHSHIGIMNV